MNSTTEVPPPEQRLCVKHDKPICPSQLKKGSKTTGCYQCINEWGSGQRSERWKTEFIPCANHPSRKCLRALYVPESIRLCWKCNEEQRGASRRHQIEKLRQRVRELEAQLMQQTDSMALVPIK